MNDFFASDCTLYAKALMGKSYCYTLDRNPLTIVAAFTVSNDSIRTNEMPNSRKKRFSKLIPYPKRTPSYPAVLIGRLGVNTDFRGKGIGNELMDFIKNWFTIENKTGCRFLVVDSYNEVIPLTYYSKCGFNYLFENEELERESHHLTASDNLRTRAMYFDLIHCI